jgi:hypothetical protein
MERGVNTHPIAVITYRLVTPHVMMRYWAWDGMTMTRTIGAKALDK